MSVTGFTLTELLVVIGIIGILAVLMLVTTVTARNKADDARVRNDIAQVRWQAEIVYNAQGGSFLNWSNHPDIGVNIDILSADIDDATGQANSLNIRESAVQQYCASAPLKTNPVTYYCIDSSAVFRTHTDPCPATGPALCPSS